jgi:hypothetical protein
MKTQLTFLALAALVLLPLLCACDGGDDYRIGIEIVEPLDDPPLDRAERLEITVTNSLDPEQQAFFSTDAGDGGFEDLGFALDGVDYYAQFMVQASAFDADDKLIARGRSVDVVTKSYDGTTVAVYLAPPGSSTRPPVELTRARAGLALASPNDSDVLIIGGAAIGDDGGWRDTVGPVGYFAPPFYTLETLKVDDTTIRVGDGLVGHCAVTLSGTAVLVVGGLSRAGDATAYLDAPLVLDAELEGVVEDVTLDDAFAPRTRSAVAPVLALGEAWICGGEDAQGALLSDCARVDADTRTLTAADSLDTGRAGHTMTALLDSDFVFLGVVIYGGNQEGEAPAAFWSADADGPVAIDDSSTETRSEHAAALMGKGRVLVAGGLVDGVASASALVISNDCTTDSPCMAIHRKASVLQTARSGHTLTALTDTLAVACGGRDADGATLKDCEYLSVSADGVKSAGRIDLLYARERHAAILLPDGTALIAGGYNPQDGVLTSVEIVSAPQD